MKPIRIATIWVLLWLTACAAQRPVLSSDPRLTSAGAEVAEREVDECLARARVAATERRDRENVAANAASSSVVGAAAGGAGGAVVGEAGRGAAAGAVGGAVASLTAALMRGLFGARQPDLLYRDYAERCLRERGYDIAGWK